MENPSRSTTIFSGFITILLGISWGLAEYNVIPIDPKIFEPLLTVFGAITVIAGVFAFSTRDASDTETLSNRDLLIQAVQNNWIDDGKGNGFLQDALRDATIQVDMEGKPNHAGDSVKFRDYDLPIDLVFREHDKRDNIKHSADILRKTFQHVEKKLLILGEAGTGKTVLLLQLTETLLNEARDIHAPIPVVFNLASWAEERLSLTDWLKKRFKTDYGVSDKLSTELIAGDSLIYCLDGFDEVAENYRADCLGELNKFMTATRQVVICSRIDEFEALAQPLNTKYAIEIQTLEDRQFKQLLQENIPYPETVAKILETLQADNKVWQEIKKPLFANILINTYADGAPFPEHNIDGTTEQKVYALIIAPYITRQLQNKTPSQKNLDNALIPRYLAWIANNLHQREQTVFYIEMLQADWLPNKRLGRWLRRELEIHFKVHFQLSLSSIYWEIKNNWISFLIMGLFVGLPFGLIVGLVTRLIIGLVFGLISGLFFVLFWGLISVSPVNQRSKFNQGFNNTLILGLVFGLITMLFFWLVFGLVARLIGLVVGLVLGLGFGLISGLIDVIKHIILRLMLENKKLAPRRYDRFLEHVIERRIMRRVGGSAVFIHRYVQEYFADQWTQRYQSDFEE